MCAMLMRSVTLASLLLLIAGLLSAADVTGTYTGTFRPEGGDESGAVLHLKQSGGEITGTAGPGEDQQWPIENGKIEGNKITAQLKNPDGPVLKLELTVDGNRITGDVLGTMADGVFLSGAGVTSVFGNTEITGTGGPLATSAADGVSINASTVYAAMPASMKATGT